MVKSPFFYYIFYINDFVNSFSKNFGKMAHNVPAVYDVFAARIRALRSKDQGCKNVAEFWRGNAA
jgi:hypothetical protein